MTAIIELNFNVLLTDMTGANSRYPISAKS